MVRSGHCHCDRVPAAGEFDGVLHRLAETSISAIVESPAVVGACVYLHVIASAIIVSRIDSCDGDSIHISSFLFAAL